MDDLNTYFENIKLDDDIFIDNPDYNKILMKKYIDNNDIINMINVVNRLHTHYNLNKFDYDIKYHNQISKIQDIVYIIINNKHNISDLVIHDLFTDMYYNICTLFEVV